MKRRKHIWLIALISVAPLAVTGWWHLDSVPSSTALVGKNDGPFWSMWSSQIPNGAPTLGTGPNPPIMEPQAIGPEPTTMQLDTNVDKVQRGMKQGANTQQP